MRDRLVTKVTPAIPPEARTQRISGTVVLKLVVGEDGRVESATAVSGPEPLRASYVDAVKQWVYMPFALHGRKLPVETTVTLILSKDAASEPFEPMRAGACGAGCDNYVPQQQPPPSRVRVSPGVMQGQLIHRVEPLYPLDGKFRVQGAAVLHALIGRDGHVQTLDRFSGPVMLRDAAVKAVSQWEYRPYLLNGEPREVDTIIRVNFAISKLPIQP